MTADDVRKLYETEVMKHERDQRDHAGLDLKAAMIRATRTQVYARLELDFPAPPAEPNEDPADTHQRQKAHQKALWKEADRLVAEALA